MNNNPFHFDEKFGSHHFLELPGGRRLSYSILGDVKGYPVIHCHGGLVCRLDVARESATAREHGVKLISIDRPGVACSDPMPGRSMLDWADDVAAVCDHLGIDRFSVTGWSMGGQYAIALGYALPRRVEKVGVIAGCIPPDHPRMMPELNSMDRLLSRLSIHVPPLAAVVFALIRFAARYMPGLFMRNVKNMMSASHPEEIMGEFTQTYYLEMFRQAMLHPRGMVEEYRVFGSPWGFDPAEMTRPLTWWTGDKDTLVPSSWNPVIRELFPGIQLVEMEDEGHFLLYRNFGEILETVKRR